MPTDTEAHQRCIKLEARVKDCEKLEDRVKELEGDLKDVKRSLAAACSLLNRIDRRTEGSMRIR